MESYTHMDRNTTQTTPRHSDPDTQVKKTYSRCTVLWSCTLENNVSVLTNVTPINSIKKDIQQVKLYERKKRLKGEDKVMKD